MKQYRNIVICMCILLLLAGGAYAQQKTVRILAIGNSFSQDAVEQYLHELAEAEGISTIIGNMFIGGCSLERHVKNARDNAPAYAYRKIGTKLFEQPANTQLARSSSPSPRALPTDFSVGNACLSQRHPEPHGTA